MRGVYEGKGNCRGIEDSKCDEYLDDEMVSAASAR